MSTFPMAYKPWSQAMDKEFIFLLSSGTPSDAIALKMGRSELALSQRMMLLHNRSDLVMLPKKLLERGTYGVIDKARKSILDLSSQMNLIGVNYDQSFAARIIAFLDEMELNLDEAADDLIAQYFIACATIFPAWHVCIADSQLSKLLSKEVTIDELVHESFADLAVMLVEDGELEEAAKILSTLIDAKGADE